MALMNLLKASFTGKLGEVTGSTIHGQPVIKAAIFSKAPPTKAQTQSVRAFECLNRLSSAIAAIGFSYLGLSDKTMLKHNAVAKWLKPAIKNHIFNIANLTQVIGPPGDLLLEAFVYNRNSGQALVRLRMRNHTLPTIGVKAFTLILSDTGRAFFTGLYDLDNITIETKLPTEPKEVYSLLVFLSTPIEKGYKISNLIYKRGPGMQYSLDEQLTGDLWLDGKSIYQLTFSFVTGTLSGSAPFAIQLPLKNTSDLITFEIYSPPQDVNSSTLNGQILSFQTLSGNNTLSSCTITYFPSVDGLVFMLQPATASFANDFSNRQFYVTVRYTKSG